MNSFVARPVIPKTLAHSLLLAAMALIGVLGLAPRTHAALTAVNDAVTTNEDTDKIMTVASLTANDSGGVTPYSIISVSGAVNGTVTLQNSNTEVKFSPTAQFSGTASFTYTLQDSTASTPLTATATVTVTVDPLSDAPTLTVQNATGDEDTSIPLNITVTATDTSETLGVLISSIPTGAGLDNTSHDVPTISGGSVSLTTSQLSGLSIKPPANSKTQIALVVTGKSKDGTAAEASSAAQTLTVTINAVSDVPTLTMQNASGNEDTAIPLTITVAATDSSEALSATISNIPGGSTLDNQNHDVPAISNNSVTLTSDKLAGLTIKPPANSDADFALHISASSKDGNAIAASTQTVTLNVLVNPVNDAPVFTMSANTITVDEDSGSRFFSNWTTGVSAGPQEFSQTLTFQVTANPTTLFSDQPVISVDGHLTFTPAQNANGSSTVTVILKDNGGTANGGADTSASVQFTINVTSINDPPSIKAPLQQPVNEDATLVFSSANLNLISVADPDATGSIRMSISVQSGKVNLSTITGLTFLSAAGTTTPPPTANNSLNIIAEGTVSALNTALAGVSYTPNTGFNGSDNLVMVASDLGSSGNGGTLTHTTSTFINVIAVNDPPVANNATFNVPENSPFGFNVGKVVATDPDVGSSLQFIITSGNTDGVFGINRDSGDIYVAGPLNFETLGSPTFTLGVLVSDNGNPSLSASATITINVQDINEPPRIDRQMFTMGENAANATAIGTLAASDPDAGANGTKTFSIISGNEDGKFALSAAGALTVAGNLDFEARNVYHLNVSVADGGSPALSEVGFIEIKVNDLNEPPIIQPQTFAVDENVPPGAHVGSVQANDPDAGNRVAYSITAGDPNGKFRIDQVTGVISVVGALDFEAANTSSYSLTVKATDNGNPVKDASATVTVNVNNLNEIPVITVPIANNAPAEQSLDEDATLTFSSAATRLISISDDSGDEPIDLTLKTEHGKLKLGSLPTGLVFQSGADDTGRMRIRAKVADLNAALNGLQYTPMPNYFGPDFLEIVADDRGFAGAGGPQSRVTGIPLKIRPVIDGAPAVQSVTAQFGKLSDETISIDRNPVDGSEVTHFQITDITGGRLFHNNGRNEIINGNFIAWFEAFDLRFQPATITPPVSFKVKASLRDESSGLGGDAATVQITVVRASQFITLGPIPGGKTFGEPAFPVAGLSSSGQPVDFTASGPATISADIALAVFLRGGDERPNPVATPGTGSGTGSIVGSQLTLSITYSGLTGAATGAHIHGPAGPDQIAPDIITLQPPAGSSFGASGTLTTSVPLTPEQKDAISSGQAYVNIHTAANPGGEIRGQLIVARLVALTGAGVVTLTASQAGDNRFEPAPNVTHQIFVSKANQQIGFSAIPNKVYGDPDFPLPAAPTASSGLPVRIEVASGPAVLTVNPTTQAPDGNIRILGAGTVTLAAFQDGNANYNPAQPVSQNFNVQPAPLTVAISPTTASRSFGQPNPAFGSPGFTVSVTGLKNQDPITVLYATTAHQNSPIGNYPIFPIMQDPAGKLANYAINKTQGTLTVTENAAPVALAQQVSVNEDAAAPLAITLAGQDAEGALLSFEIGAPPQNGALSGIPPAMHYLPNPNFNGTDTFTFRVNDGLRNSAAGTITITVNPINDPPTLDPLRNIGVLPNAGAIVLGLNGIKAGPQNELPAEQAQPKVTISATSSDPTKITVTGVAYTAPNSTATLTLNTVTGATSGSSVIRVTVDDHEAANPTSFREFTVTLSPRVVRGAPTTAVAGGPVIVPVELIAQGDENAVGFTAFFDRTKMTFVNATLGPDAPNATIQFNGHELDNGLVGVSVALPASLVFAAGTKRIVLLNFNIPVTTPESEVIIHFGSPFPVPPQVVGAQADPLAATFTGAPVSIILGYEADVTSVQAENVSDNDGNVTTLDWVKTGRLYIGLDTAINPGQFRRADSAPRANLGNGVIDLEDWVQAGRYSVGLDKGTDDKVPKAGGPAGQPQGATQGLGSGESSVALKSSSRAARNVRLHDRRIQRGQNFLVLASVDARGDENALGFSLRFDPAAVRFVGARLAGEAKSATLLANERELESGRVGLAFALPAGKTLPAGAGAVIELEFSAVTSSADEASLIQLVDAPVRRQVVSAAADELRADFSDARISIEGSAFAPTGLQLSKPLAVVDRMLGGEMLLRLTGETGSQYLIESSSDLSTWTPMKTVTVTNGQIEFVDVAAKGFPGRFYRVSPVR